MIFRRKSPKTVTGSYPEVTNYALTSKHPGKSGSSFGNKIVNIIEKSSFCSSSPLVKRLVVQNVKVWCIVIETSGSTSVRSICVSLPFMLNLIAKTSPRFKSLLEDESVAAQLKLFREIDFESVLSSVCNATVVIHKGVQKCYAVISVHLGREAFLLTKSSLGYLKALFLRCMVTAFHFLCDDMPLILQSLCSQNYAIAKYFVRNLPLIALAGAKHLLLFTLFMQRLAAAGVETVKQLLKFSSRILSDVCSDVDFVQLFRRMYRYFLTATRRIATKNAYKTVRSVVIQFVKACSPILKDSAHFAWAHVCRFVKQSLPVLRAFIARFVSSLPKLLKFCDDNKTNALRVIMHGKQCLKDLLCEIKPLCVKLFKVLRLSTERIFRLFRCIIPHIKLSIIEIYRSLKRFVTSEIVRKVIRAAFRRAKDLQPVAYELYLKGCHTLMILCKFLLKSAKSFLSSFRASLLHEMNSFFKPVVTEVNATCYDCANEIMNASYLCAQKVAPSLWNGWKAVSPVGVRASWEIYATTKSTTLLLYPELSKAVVVVVPEFQKGLTVVLEDGSHACAEVVTVSYFASRKLLSAAKCVSLQLPVVFNALCAVSVTSSGAVAEVILTSSKAGNRVQRDVRSAMREVSLAMNGAQFELMDVVSELACEMNSVVLNEDVSDLLVFLSHTHNSILVFMCKQYLMAIRDFSVVSYSTFQYSLAKMKYFLQCIGKYIQSGSSKTHSSVMNLFPTLFSSDCARQCFKALSLAFFNKMCVFIPSVWEQSKVTNAIVWNHFCQSSSQLWTLLEMEASTAFHLTCSYTPELWDYLKRGSYQTWLLTCDLSPVLWDRVQPMFPVLWTWNRNAIQCVWELNVQTCTTTWGVIVPATSFSWKYLLNSSPKVWIKFCENSKSQWNSFCNVVELSWNAMTLTSSFSWRVFHDTVSKSWKCVLRPVTTSACGGATSAVTKTLKLSNSVCSKSKEFLFVYKTSLFDFSDIQLE